MLTTKARQEHQAGATADAEAPFSFALPANHKILLAVSGGGDSMAMLHLVHAALGQHEATSRLVVATVDHGLRPGSADEARMVGTACHALGISHETLKWEGKKPETGLQASAREARYRLLADFAASKEIGSVLIAHNSDDQAETLAMRRRRSVSPSLGLAGIAPATFWRSGNHGVWFMRPLLDVGGSRLRDWLQRRGHRYIDDPSNENPRFERVRIRQDGSSLPVASGALAGYGTRRRDLDRDVAAMIASSADIDTTGIVVLRWAHSNNSSDAVVLETMRVLLAFVGGREYRPTTDDVVALLDRLPSCGRSSLARCVVTGHGDRYVIEREKRGIAALHVPGQEDSRRLPYPFARAIPSHDLAVAQQIERLCGMTPTGAPPETIVYDTYD